MISEHVREVNLYKFSPGFTAEGRRINGKTAVKIIMSISTTAPRGLKTLLQETPSNI